MSDPPGRTGGFGGPVPPGPANTVVLLREVARARGDTDAFVEASGERISFAQWDRAADGIAGALAERGVTRGDVVCLFLPSSIRYMVSYQSAMRLGALTSGVNLRLGPSEVRHILGALRPRLCVVDAPGPQAPSQSIASVLSASGLAVVGWDDLEAHLGDRPPPLPVLGLHDPVVVCWTGGTTGVPKGVVFGHANLRAIARAAGPLSAPLDRRLSPLPFSHVGTMTRAWDEIERAITTVITPPRWSAPAALRLMAAERVTVAQGVPTQWELMLRDETFARTDLSSLRLAASGGSRVPRDLLRAMRAALGVPVINRYASTEAGIITGTHPQDPEDVVTETVGRPAPGVELRIVDDRGLPVGAGTPGRVQVRSTAVMRGYWQDPHGTAAVLGPDGWLSVGDLGSLDQDGNLRLLGRNGEMYVRGGYNVYPVEVERVLAEHPGVAQVAVVAAPDPVLGEVGVAFVVPEPGARFVAETPHPAGPVELRTWVQERLADYKVPDAVLLCDRLPLTALSKVDRRALGIQATQSIRSVRDTRPG